MASLQTIRERTNSRPVMVSAIALIVAATVLGCSLLSISHTRSAEELSAKAFFMDEATGQVIVAPTTKVAPMRGKGGKLTVVRAIYYTLGTDEEKQLAFLSKMATDPQATPSTPSPSSGSAMPGVLVRSPQPGSAWVQAGSPEGRAVRAALDNQQHKPGFRIVVPP